MSATDRNGGERALGAGMRLVVTGDASSSRAVAEELRNLHLELVLIPWGADSLDRIGDDGGAVILVEPVDEPALAAAVDMLRSRQRSAGVPVLIAVGNAATDAEILDLYRRGASFIFRWPRQRAELADLVAYELGKELVHGPSGAPEEALARAACCQAEVVAGPLGNNVSVEVSDVFDAVAELSGYVTSLQHKTDLAHAVASTPGIRDVDVRRLFVPTAGVADVVLERRVRHLLHRSPEIDDSTLTASVRGGYAFVAGTLAGDGERESVHATLVRVTGLRGIRDYAVVSPAAKARDADRSRRLAERVARVAGSDSGLTVRCFGNVAVLRGRAENSDEAEACARVLESDPAVERVINDTIVD